MIFIQDIIWPLLAILLLLQLRHFFSPPGNFSKSHKIASRRCSSDVNRDDFRTNDNLAPVCLVIFRLARDTLFPVAFRKQANSALSASFDIFFHVSRALHSSLFRCRLEDTSLVRSILTLTLTLISTLFAMMITLRNFVILLGSLLLTCGALSHAMEENKPGLSPELSLEPSPGLSSAGQLPAKSVIKRDSQLDKLPLEVIYYMTKFLNAADFLHLMRTDTYFNDKLLVLLFTKIKLTACQRPWKVPRCLSIGDYKEFKRRADFFSVVSQSDVDLLNCALLVGVEKYLKAENCADKKFLLAIAMHNKFTDGIPILQENFNITPENCQELIGNMKFPLTEGLLITAIRLISPLELEKLLNGEDADFDPSVNDDAILKALVYAVHHRKMDHAEVLFKCQYIETYFSPENFSELPPYIDYSCKNFDDASFIEFLIEKQPTNTGEFVFMYANSLMACHRTDALFNLFTIAPIGFYNYFLAYCESGSCQFCQKPKELFVMLQDCSLKILPWISYASWEQFASAPYNDHDVKCLFEKYRSPKKHRALSAAQCWKEITAKFDEDRNSLDQSILLEKETFLVVFMKYFCKEIRRFMVIVDFLNEKPFLLKPMRDNILAHFRNPLQDQSYFKHLEEIGFAFC